VFRRADRFAYALLAGAVLLGLGLWSALPDPMAVHFGADGAVDGVLAKPLAVVLAPAVGAVVVLAVRHAPGDDSPAVRRATVLFVGVTVAGLQTFVYLWNLGHRVSPALVVGTVLVGAALLVGYAVARE
jgi:uncharacterized membrane protein